MDDFGRGTKKTVCFHRDNPRLNGHITQDTNLCTHAVKLKDVTRRQFSWMHGCRCNGIPIDTNSIASNCVVSSDPSQDAVEPRYSLHRVDAVQITFKAVDVPVLGCGQGRNDAGHTKAYPDNNNPIPAFNVGS